MRRGITGVTAVVLLCFGTFLASGQPGVNPNGGQAPGQPAPISGIEILIGLGGLLGAKKIFDAKRKKN